MDVKRCDRCGAIYARKNGTFLVTGQKERIATMCWNGMPCVEMDICSACKDEFDKWFACETEEE